MNSTGLEGHRGELLASRVEIHGAPVSFRLLLMTRPACKFPAAVTALRPGSGRAPPRTDIELHLQPGRSVYHATRSRGAVRVRTAIAADRGVAHLVLQDECTQALLGTTHVCWAKEREGERLKLRNEMERKGAEGIGTCCGRGRGTGGAVSSLSVYKY